MFLGAALSNTVQSTPKNLRQLLNQAVRFGAGYGVKKDSAKARKLYLEAAKLGSAQACYEVGMCYLCDKPKSIEEGLLWIRRAARKSVADAQYLLGDVYAQGMLGKKKNVRAALHWYRKAAAGGDNRAKDAIREIRANRQSTH